MILSADVVGYSAHIAADEEGTIRRFAKLEACAGEIIAGHAGRIFNTAGDAFLAEFESAVDAVRAALDVLEVAETLAHEAPTGRGLALRIGIAFGDVVVTDSGNLLGDGVNIAARLQALAAAGTLCISREVQSLVQNKIALSIQDLGEQRLKNIPNPVHAFAIRPANTNAHSAERSGSGHSSRSSLHIRDPWLRLGAIAALIGIAGSAGIVLLQRSDLPLSSPSVGPTVDGCPVFPADNIWNTRIDHLPTHTRSAAYITSIGADKPLRPGFGAAEFDGAPLGIPYVVVPSDQPPVPVHFEPFGDEPHAGDESDAGPFPIPPDAPIEGGPQSTDDRHVIVVQQGSCMLVELYKAQQRANGEWAAVAAAKFDLRSNALRKLRHTSADSAGLPIFAGLVRHSEVESGEIRHALRFSAPRTRKAALWPARKFASSLTDDALPAMGQRFRLRSDFDTTGFSKKNQVILTALKRYGMILAHNGSPWFLSGAPDLAWNDDELRELRQIKGVDFEAVDVAPLMIDEETAQARRR